MRLDLVAFLTACAPVLTLAVCPAPAVALTAHPPNILIIYADDLGYGDIGCQGATGVATPHIDRIAREGLRFTDAYATSSTCTPSRYSMLTGEYAWRRKGTGVLPGDAALIIEPGRTTLASLLKAAGYETAVVGKWHLGLGGPGLEAASQDGSSHGGRARTGKGGLDWNGEIRPGPLEIGFDHAFIVPATGDRVPCVYVEDHRVVGLDPADPIRVSFGEAVGEEPTGKARPDLLKLHPSHGHDQTIVNGISRIGTMAGGQAARWVDEDMSDVLTARAIAFLERHVERRPRDPFFLYFATHDIHVPRVPHPRFVGRTPMGPRGDAIAQLDDATGKLLAALDRLDLTERTLVIFSSDNGPVVDDGYRDQAVEKLGDHRPGGPLRGGKYSLFEAGTRVPFLVRWPGRVRPGVSGALVSQVDLLASLARLTGQALASGGEEASDSQDILAALLGDAPEGRDAVVEHSGGLTLRTRRWKYIEPTDGPGFSRPTGTETGRSREPQLYDLAADLGEERNLAAEEPKVLAELRRRLEELRGGRPRKTGRAERSPTERARKDRGPVESGAGDPVEGPVGGGPRVAARPSGAALPLGSIDLVCVDPRATGYATFQSHNQKVVSNERGIFLTHIRTRNEPYTAQTWRLSWSHDGGTTFRTVYEATHATNPPVIETDEAANVYLVRPDFLDGNAYLYRFLSGDDYTMPLVSTIPGGAAGKFAMTIDLPRRQLYYFAHNATFDVLGLDGGLRRRVELLRPGASALLQYPLLSLEASGALFAAWTTQAHGRYLYWDIHWMRSEDGGVSWRRLDGGPLEAPIVADEGGPTDRVSLDEEREAHTWLSSFLVRGRKAHFLYLAQMEAPRQHCVRYDLETGARELDRADASLRGDQLALRGLDGFFATRASAPDAPLYVVSRDAVESRLVCLVSLDGGSTWHDHAVSEPVVNPYSIGGARELTADGRIVGSFTESIGATSDPQGGSRVHFFSIRGLP